MWPIGRSYPKSRCRPCASAPARQATRLKEPGSHERISARELIRKDEQKFPCVANCGLYFSGCCSPSSPILGPDFPSTRTLHLPATQLCSKSHRTDGCSPVVILRQIVASPQTLRGCTLHITKLRRERLPRAATGLIAFFAGTPYPSSFALAGQHGQNRSLPTHRNRSTK